MSELLNNIVHAFDNVSAGTLQLTAIVGIAFLYLGFSYLFSEAAAPGQQGPATAAKPTPAPKRVAPLRDDELSRKAHQVFKQYPVLTVSSGCLLAPGHDISEQLAHVLREAANVSKVHVIVHDTSGADEAAVRQQMQRIGLLGSGAGQVPSHRILPCTTSSGKVAIVRQIEPALHVESDASVATELHRFKQRVEALRPPPADDSLVAFVSKAAVKR